jgi:hypothetical protein
MSYPLQPFTVSRTAWLQSSGDTLATLGLVVAPAATTIVAGVSVVQSASRSTPYGTRIEGAALVPDREEQLVVAKIVDVRAEGNSPATIAACLDAEGLAARHGVKWTPGMVRSVLRRERAW